MKKLIVLLIKITTLTNLSYASFPVDTNRVKSTTMTETTEQFHLRMEEQGFDISSCTCVSCRDGKIKANAMSENMSYNRFYKMASIFFILALIAGVVWVYDGVACINDVSTCSRSYIPIIIELGLMTIFGYTAIYYFIKGLAVQEKNK